MGQADLRWEVGWSGVEGFLSIISWKRNNKRLSEFLSFPSASVRVFPIPSATSPPHPFPFQGLPLYSTLVFRMLTTKPNPTQLLILVVFVVVGWYRVGLVWICFCFTVFSPYITQPNSTPQVSICGLMSLLGFSLLHIDSFSTCFVYKFILLLLFQIFYFYSLIAFSILIISLMKFENLEYYLSILYMNCNN